MRAAISVSPSDICESSKNDEKVPKGHFVRRKTVSYFIPMIRQTRLPSAFSKVSVKSQTLIPREVRDRLDLKAPSVNHDGSTLSHLPISLNASSASWTA